MSKINIKNITNKPMMFVLPHQKVCVVSGRCLCNKDGSPSSLHIMAGCKVEADGAVVHAPDVAKTLKSKKRQIVIEQIKEKKVVEKKAQESNANENYSGNEVDGDGDKEDKMSGGRRGKNKK